MSKLSFDWNDEDPGALIVLVLALLLLLYVPWSSCAPTATLAANSAPAQTAPAAAP